MKLSDFQHSNGIPFEEQLILINNPNIFDGFSPVFSPWKPSPLKKLLARFTAISARWRKLKSNRIFAGYFDRSFDHLERLDSVFDAIRRNVNEEYELVIGKGDYLINDTFLSKLPNNVTKLFANNVDVLDERVQYLPMVRDFRSIGVFENRKPNGDKRILCYCNFSTNTHPVRQAVAQLVKDKQYVSKQHFGTFLNYKVSRTEFYDDLESAKFCICPRGNAFDTFRMWDALYCGTIPIVVKEAVFHDSLSDLPIYFINSYETFGDLDEAQLEETYQEMRNTVYNFEKLKAAHWLS